MDSQWIGQLEVESTDVELHRQVDIKASRQSELDVVPEVFIGMELAIVVRRTRLLIERDRERGVVVGGWVAVAIENCVAVVDSDLDRSGLQAEFQIRPQDSSTKRPVRYSPMSLAFDSRCLSTRNVSVR